MKKFITKVVRILRDVEPNDASVATDYTIRALDEPFRTALLSMYRGESQVGSDGQLHSIDKSTRIVPAQGTMLYDLCLDLKPKATLEIGMAYGYSTLYFLAALVKNASGSHTVIDPFQNTHWHGIGITRAKTLADEHKMGASLRLIEGRSDRVCADLVRAGTEFDLIFIDGNHRFDDVLVDFYLCAQLCASGGRIILDDMWLPSIRTVAEFIRSNRSDFTELPTTQKNVAMFQKVSQDRREWDDFRSFAVSPPNRSSRAPSNRR